MNLMFFRIFCDTVVRLSLLVKRAYSMNAVLISSICTPILFVGIVVPYYCIKRMYLTRIQGFYDRQKQKRLDNIKHLFFSKYYFSGLGYKVYTRLNQLFIWVGFTHYTILSLPNTLKIFAKKRRTYLVSSSKTSLKLFLAAIKRVRKLDIYKGKGLLEVKSYKNFIKMKTGKKKQY